MVSIGQVLLEVCGDTGGLPYKFGKRLGKRNLDCRALSFSLNDKMAKRFVQWYLEILVDSVKHYYLLTENVIGSSFEEILDQIDFSDTVSMLKTKADIGDKYCLIKIRDIHLYNFKNKLVDFGVAFIAKQKNPDKEIQKVISEDLYDIL